MKQFIILLLPFYLSLGFHPAKSQTDEAAQLLLNVIKLSQLKQILTDLEKGYTTLRTGYSQIENLASGNFSLHESFLNQLLQVSPAVRNYHKVAEIISYQIKLVKDYKRAFAGFKSSGHFTVNEISYLSQVYGNLFEMSLQQLDELTMVLTAGKLRMSDQERLEAIDRIHLDIQDKLIFLSAFNQETQVLAISRSKASQELNGIRNLYRKRDN
ncbi:TerB family tellurite resistance protein [Algoriphagus sp. D3-2-R+10]|uniref:TerB family tellurite resistance protein n=1 Tax=Algoriphagus aurantiacus TaxID=3103948 RepID=UPI002B3D6FC7|nr:TerB family tellurite resistance protein [Algoriphagus sp. D3-2-R+10]MEB2774640.1 TerB family tellurite resistance protein [Algoriphagus sp. D3-2-R+10]